MKTLVLIFFSVMIAALLALVDPAATEPAPESAGPPATSPTPSSDVTHIREKALKGDVRAQYELGQMYEDGFDLPQNNAEARKWYAKAAAQGDIDAQYRLGSIYYWGQDVTKNYQEAYNWFKKAAEQGDPYAQFNLGVMHRKGRGTTSDYVEAYKWFSLAADQDDEDAKRHILSLEKEMSPNQLQQARQAIADWHKAHP